MADEGPPTGGIRRSVTDGVATLLIDNPSAANALTAEMFAELGRSWAWVENDPTVNVAVLAAAGDRHFCAGADVSEIADGSVRKAGEQLVFTPRQAGITKPVVVAMTGLTIGGGLALVTDADIVVASANAVIRDPHVALGQICGYATYRLATMVPPTEAARLALSGGELTAARAHTLGIVNEIHPSPDAARAAAHALAQRIASASPPAIRQTLGLLHDLALGMPEADVLQQAMRRVDAHLTHPDATEGPKAWMDRRPPRWADPTSTPSRSAR